MRTKAHELNESLKYRGLSVVLLMLIITKASAQISYQWGITGRAGSAVVLRGTARSLRTRDYVAASARQAKGMRSQTLPRTVVWGSIKVD